jgi:hypothetical protein
MYVCMHACMYVRMYVCAYVCMHACVCMYVDRAMAHAVSLSPLRLRFAPGSVHVGFVVDKMALGLVFLSQFFGFSSQYHSTIASYVYMI